MKKLKGISVYVGLSDYNIEETKKYLDTAKAKGVDFVFTSAHIPEADIKDDFQKMLDYAEKLNLPLIVDVSKPMMEKFKLPKNIGALRLDYGFTIEDVVKYSQELPYLVELNASCMTRSYLEKLKALDANFNNIRISHNFYPKRYTGLDIFNMKKLNEMYKEYGLTIFAYVPSNSGKRPPLYDGLPTVESHRDMPLSIAIQELYAALCDGVCIGDAYISENDFNTLINQSDIYEIPIKIRKDLTETELFVLNSNHTFRIDEGNYLKRSSRARGVKITPNNTITIEPYMVTIDNEQYGRYTGEVSIALLEMTNRGQVNVVGQVIDSGKTLVDLIPPASKFVFKIVGYLDE